MSKGDRIGIMERRRALETARNMLYSKVGKAVLEDNKFPNRSLDLTVKRIDVESKKNSSLIDNDKKMFKRARLIYNLEPTILLERPSSPSKKNYESSTEVTNSLPNYMTALKRSEPITGTTDMPPTIDAFTPIRRKTKNIWEPKYTDEDLNRKFRSIIMESPPLNEQEGETLDKGYAIFRPPSKNEEDEQRRIQEKKREKIMMLREVQRSPSPDAQMLFITQLDRDAMSRGSRSFRTRSGITSERPSSELSFNPFHLEAFEKMRNKQKKKFFAKIKL